MDLPKTEKHEVQQDDTYEHDYTDHDSLDMNRLGRSQQLKRTFHPLSSLGLVMIIMQTWLGMIVVSSFSLVNGGRAGTIWLYILTWIFQIPSIASMAEMASMAPTSAGQYHWVSEFSPPSAQKFLSYISGWLSALGWQTIVAGNSFNAGQYVLILASLNGSYEPKAWHGCLMTIAFALFCTSFNIWGARWLPLFEHVVLLFSIVGFFAVLIPLWVLSPRVSSSEVWTQFNNGGDWATTGVATIIGLISTSNAFLGADSAAHLSEETENASLTVPRVMFWGLWINAIMGFASTLTYLYCIQDIQEQIVDSTATFPFIMVFKVSTKSNAAAIGMTIPWAVITIASAMNAIAAGSRQAWAFARDGGLPASSWFQQIRVMPGGIPLPLNSIFAMLSLTVVLALIQLGSLAAFNSIAGLCGAAISFSYAISIGCVLWRRLFGDPLPPARWSLGRWGLLANASGFAFQLLCTVINFFPAHSKPTVMNMNWASAIFGAVAILATTYYVARGHIAYVGPVALVKQT